MKTLFEKYARFFREILIFPVLFLSACATYPVSAQVFTIPHDHSSLGKGGTLAPGAIDTLEVTNFSVGSLEDSYYIEMTSGTNPLINLIKADGSKGYIRPGTMGLWGLNPFIRLISTTAAANEGIWDITANSIGSFSIDAVGDVSGASEFLAFGRDGATVDTVTLCNSSDTQLCDSVTINTHSLVVKDSDDTTTIEPDFFATGSLSATTVGCTVEDTETINWQVVGEWVSIDIPLITCTSDDVGYYFETTSTLPDVLKPSGTIYTMAYISDDGGVSWGTAYVDATTFDIVFRFEGSDFTNSGLKSVLPFTMYYRVN